MAIELFNQADILPGIALDQPFAGLVRLGLKDLETRMFRVHKRGMVVICATMKTRTNEQIEQRVRHVPSRVSSMDFTVATAWNGCVVALANLVDCRLLTKADESRACFWSDADAGKRYAWELQDIRPLVPHPIRCMPGFFAVNRSLVEVVT